MPKSLPPWVYRDRKPEDDRVYFENLTRIVFEAGMSWRIIANKWPNFPPAFSGFDIDMVAAYGAEDIKRLNEDASIIRNKQKTLARAHVQGNKVLHKRAGPPERGVKMDFTICMVFTYC